jgi:3-deoxy-manno-octulosonate cytidylyltransferase (CMP-KDO synthetase)
MILFHSKDDISVLGFLNQYGLRGSGENRIPRMNSNELCGFRESNEAGMLSLPVQPPQPVVTSAAPTNPIVLIPTRLAATRLPNKPLAEIVGTPMILHVWRRANEAAVGPVVVACGDPEIAEIIEHAGGRAVLTDPELPTGSDRIHAAITLLDPARTHDAVINVQGDMPMLAPEAIGIALAALADPETDIATLAAEIADEKALHATSVNKVAAGFADRARPTRALYFSKAPVPWGEGPHYEHIGLYAYRRAALDRFVTLPQGVLERRERLEQLRALEAGMRISVSLIEPSQLGVQVDTPDDLARARQMMGG